jgi:hypothetical protein
MFWRYIFDEAGTNLAFTSQVPYFFAIKRELPTEIRPQKPSGYFMDWQNYTIKMNVKCGLTE